MKKVGGFSKKETADIVDLVFDMMKDTLGQGERIKISGFGNFDLRDKRQRPGRNPQTGESISIPARRVLTFKPSRSCETNSILSVRRRKLHPDPECAAPKKLMARDPKTTVSKTLFSYR